MKLSMMIRSVPHISGRVILLSFFLSIGSVRESYGQWHVISTEVTGNYSSIFGGMIRRSGLRTGWNSVTNTSESSLTEINILTTIAIPIVGDFTESSMFALGLEIPYVQKQYSTVGDPEISQTGLSDLNVTGKYSFTIDDESGWVKNLGLRNTRVAFIGKVKLPTAHSDQKNDGSEMQLPVLHLGSGSFDYAFGAAILTETGSFFMIHGHAMYWIHQQGNDYKTGNNFMYELSFLVPSLRIEAEPISTTLPSVGVKGMNAARDEKMNNKIFDTGSDVLMATIGIQSLWKYIEVIGSLWMFEVTYQFPVFQRVNGVQLGYGSSIIGGVRLYVR